MRLLVQAGSFRRPVHLISRRVLSTSIPRLDASSTSQHHGKKGSFPPPPRSGDAERENRNLGKNLRAVLQSGSRGNAVSQGHDPKSRLRLGTRQKNESRHGLFRSTVFTRFQSLLDQLNGKKETVAGLSEDELNQQAAQFIDALDQSFQLAEKNVTDREKNPVFWNLRDAFILKDLKGLSNEIQYSFQSFIIRQRFAKGMEASHKKLLDFRFPHEWFPATRALQRTIHVHVGPTNSGKTYNALKALENSKRGVYAGPLRLLATEVYQRMIAKGLPCALLTGEEVRIPENTDRYFHSCTVEMTPLNTQFDVAVIDEIQMIADHVRGSAWTSALLGVQAKEVHVCGEERTARLIQSIAASIGDKCIVHRYERLSPLKTMNEAIEGDYKKLQKGDCIVAFSRLNLHSLKRMVEKHTKKRCAIIYGALPPEVRVQQAALFNDPDNDYDYIVASDAIGMGLNLEIRRVILESVFKFDGSQNRMLTFPEIKQIGGRAGRYRSARNAGDVKLQDGKAPEEEKKVGLVTTMDSMDLRSIRRAFNGTVKNLEVAYIQPPAAVIERFSTYFPPDTPLSFILMRIRELATLGNFYQLGFNEDALAVADIIQDIPLTIYDRLTILNVPVSLRTSVSVDVLRALARIVSENSNGDLLSIQEIPLEFLDVDMKDFKGTPPAYLYQLESLHVAMNQYIWLSYRYAGMFRSQALAFHVRSLIEEKLIATLDKLNFSEDDLHKKRKKLRGRVKKTSREVLSDEDAEQEVDDTVIDEEMEAKLASQTATAQRSVIHEAAHASTSNEAAAHVSTSHEAS